MAEHTISERKLLEKEVDIESRLKKYQIKEKIKQYEKANKVSNAYKSVKRAFSVQSAIYDVLSKELGGEKSSEFAMLFSLGVAAKEGLETIVEKDNYGKNFFDGTQDIKFDRIVPDPVVGLYKLYSSALEFCIKANKNIEEVTSDFYKWIMKKVDEEKSKPHFAKFEAEIKKKPIVLEGKSGKKEYKACVAGTKRPDEKKKTKYTWENIGGYDDTKKELMDYARFIETYERCKTYMEDPVPKGILFYGPPGTGKTLLARTMAEQAGVPFIYVRASDVGSSYVNESMIKINEKFKEAKTYIKNGVSDCVVLFIDEIDAIASKRSDSQNKEDNKVVNTLLTNLDGDSMDGIIFLAATNRYD
ncbi:ATP-binding protein, partial [Candidatus Woesearchaeota archaeon]|nr:ATP-binding protein [Candidatus Woesearchaeota archaeon]